MVSQRPYWNDDFEKLLKLEIRNIHRLVLIFQEFPMFTSNYKFKSVTKLNRLLLDYFY